MTATARLPFEQPDPLRVAPALTALQSQGVIHKVRTAVDDEAWLVTGHAEVRQLLDDDRLGRAHPEPDSAARSGESALFGGPLGNFATEHADHARMRTLLQPHFSAKRVRALRPRVEALTAELLDELAARERPADLLDAVATPLPILVICELLGVPYDDRDQFRAWTQAAGDTRDRARSERGLGDLFGYGLELVARKRRAPADDVISRMCATEGLEDAEVAGLSMALLFAGHETTVVQLGLGALHLLGNRDQWQLLVEQPALVPGAVDELMRAPSTTGGGVPRYARAELQVDGVTVQPGELVLLDLAAANHDPAAFPEPERLDVTRRAGNHLSFGHGARYCLGAPLAKVELQAVFTQLVERFPEMRLAVPVDGLRLRTDTLTGGLIELPVRW